MGEHPTSERKGSGIAAVDHGTRHDQSARTLIGPPIEVHVVQDAGAIRCQGVVDHLLQLLGSPMLGAKTHGESEHLLALGQGHQRGSTEPRRPPPPLQNP